MYGMGQQYQVGPAAQSYGPWVGGRPGPASHMSPNYSGGQPRPNAAAAAAAAAGGGSYCAGVGAPGTGQGGGSGYMMPVRPAGYNAQFIGGQGGYVVST
jgi:hypothetical protein